MATPASLDVLLDGVLERALGIGTPSDVVFWFSRPMSIWVRWLKKLQGSSIGVGSQDVDERTQGAVTGGVSAAMVKDVAVRFALVGHSERRTLVCGTDELVADKFEQCKDLTDWCR